MLLVWILNLKGYLGNYIYMGYSFCIYYLGYFVINQSEVFPYSETNKNELNSFIHSVKDLNYRKSPMLSNELLEHEKGRLISTMINVKPFLDNELTLVKLAQIQKQSIHEVSYIINEGFRENFNQFINKYRIEESKLMLANPDSNNLNMVGIAYQSGFNSKTIFNTTFKKITGQTPSEYRNNNQKDVRNHKSEQS
jgi:AraC-like DNA-binding protein